MNDGRRLVLVAGATGYIGRRLVAELVADGHQARCLARTPGKLDAESWLGDVEVVTGDVLDRGSLTDAFRDVDAAYYLVHSIGSESDWQARDRTAAENFRNSATSAGVEQMVYLGGLGDDTAGELSPHLTSRHEVRRVLVDSLVNEVVVRNHAIDDVVAHRPIGCRDAIELALRRVGDLDLSTHWTDAELYGRSPADPIPTDPDWAGATILTDRQAIRAYWYAVLPFHRFIFGPLARRIEQNATNTAPKGSPPARAAGFPLSPRTAPARRKSAGACVRPGGPEDDSADLLAQRPE